ncbi:hypothetical protein BGZ60DRAFT_525249 [Tricladium varicosporioides]|nr:hypothetical protein BGZ60DRAFT_525249 [Hymenoscyphus varicosporioides]
MAVTEIIQFSAEPTTVDSTIQRAANSLKSVEAPRHFVIGTQIQDKGAIQITSVWDGIQDPMDFKNTSDFSSYISNLRNSLGDPQVIFHVSLNRSAFVLDGPATANVVEYVQIWFPASLVTPEFQKQIEEDFLRFDEIYRKDTKGIADAGFGWILEEQRHDTIKDERARCFFVARGWESMDHFEKSIKNDAYKESIPILLAWNAPFKMWHVERKAL